MFISDPSDDYGGIVQIVSNTGTNEPYVPPGALPPSTGGAPRPPGPTDPGYVRPTGTVSPRPPNTGTQEPRTRPTGTGEPPPPVGPPPPPRPPGPTDRTGTLPPPGQPRPPPPVEPPPPPQPPPPPTTGNPGGTGGPGTTGGPPATPGGTGRGGGVTVVARPMGPGDLGIPGGNAGSFKNLQQFLKTNAPAEAAFAQEKFAKELASEAGSSVDKAGNIPTAGEYDAAKYPARIPGAPDRPTAPTMQPVPDIIDEPGFLAGPQAWREHAESEIAHNAAVAANKKAQEDYAKALADWEKTTAQLSEANKKAIEDQKKGPQATETAKAGDIGWRLGMAATPGGYQDWLKNRGASAGASKLDAYLYGAAPQGAIQDVRNLQQGYGGLLKLVENWLPFGSTLDANGMAKELPKTASSGTGGTGGTGTTGSQPPNPRKPPEEGGVPPGPGWVWVEEVGRWMSPQAYQKWLDRQDLADRNRDAGGTTFVQ